MFENISIIIPCKNEEKSIGKLLDILTTDYAEAEIIVVNDGSTDDTAAVLDRYDSVIVCKHLYNIGNGASIKSGVSRATRDIVVMMDADGQHNPADIKRLLAKIDEGYDMVVGARDFKSQASNTRALGNGLYNRLASLMTGHKIKDLTSKMKTDCK